MSALPTFLAYRALTGRGSDFSDVDIYPTTLRAEVEKILRDATAWVTFHGLVPRCKHGDALSVWKTLKQLHDEGRVELQDEGTRNMLVRHVDNNQVGAFVRDLPIATGVEATAPRPSPTPAEAGASPAPQRAAPPPVAPSPVSHAKPTGVTKMPRKHKHGAARDLIIARLKRKPATVTEIAEDTGCTPATVSYHLGVMGKAKQVDRTDTGRLAPWRLVDDAPIKPALREETKPVYGDKDVDLALDKLQSRLEPATIANLSTKVQVLERLGKLVDPTIAKVLVEIRADLQRVAT